MFLQTWHFDGNVGVYTKIVSTPLRPRLSNPPASHDSSPSSVPSAPPSSPLNTDTSTIVTPTAAKVSARPRDLLIPEGPRPPSKLTALLAAAKPPSAPAIDLTGDDDDGNLLEIKSVSTTTRASVSHKRKHLDEVSIKSELTDADVIVLSDDDDARSGAHHVPPKPKRARRPATVAGSDFQTKITRQCHVKTIVTLTEIPKIWIIPREEGVAYIVKLSAQPEMEWKRDASGALMNMVAIITSQDHLLQS
ncbi:uncharacterized protein STEHIDRAFT_159306 [Stereum hirsutum FP-91666 SS1]|uniref:uncharacterized protein n=1 Tax=Stereum hirsutum (strain FP-91666) TaxID=721885 RepID=UPI0004449439|nr:uncharacterized protein STEHIDRAFT_159306 [Stereum hirsutum FP-91666 SS1]EIM83680.1 hypothetical protein STEHIDRAFT_159306 [Stereum hirsutum FP-91666 SS1]